MSSAAMSHEVRVPRFPIRDLMHHTAASKRSRCLPPHHVAFRIAHAFGKQVNEALHSTPSPCAKESASP